VGGARRSRRSADPGQTGSGPITKAPEAPEAPDAPDAVGGGVVPSVSDRPCQAGGPELTGALSHPSVKAAGPPSSQYASTQPVPRQGRSARLQLMIITLRSARGRAECL